MSFPILIKKNQSRIKKKETKTKSCVNIESLINGQGRQCSQPENLSWFSVNTDYTKKINVDVDVNQGCARKSGIVKNV